jgi:hypothetical protein
MISGGGLMKSDMRLTVSPFSRFSFREQRAVRLERLGMIRKAEELAGIAAGVDGDAVPLCGQRL